MLHRTQPGDFQPRKVRVLRAQGPLMPGDEAEATRVPPGRYILGRSYHGYNHDAKEGVDFEFTDVDREEIAK